MRLISNEKLDEYCYRNRLIPPKIRRQLYAPATLTGFQMATPATFRDIGNKNPLFELKYAQEYFDSDKVRENIGLQVYNAIRMLPKNSTSENQAEVIMQRAINYQLGLILTGIAEELIFEVMEETQPRDLAMESIADEMIERGQAQIQEEQEIQRLRGVRLRRVDSGVEPATPEMTPPTSVVSARATLEDRRRAAEVVARELGKVFMKKRAIINEQAKSLKQLSSTFSQSVIDEAVKNVVDQAQVTLALEDMISTVIRQNPEIPQQAKAQARTIFKQAAERGKLRLENIHLAASEASRAIIEDIVERVLIDDQGRVRTESATESDLGSMVTALSGTTSFVTASSGATSFVTASSGGEQVGTAEEKLETVGEEDIFDVPIGILEEELRELRRQKQFSERTIKSKTNQIETLEKRIKNNRQLARSNPLMPGFRRNVETDLVEYRKLRAELSELNKADQRLEGQIDSTEDQIEEWEKGKVEELGLMAE